MHYKIWWFAPFILIYMSSNNCATKKKKKKSYMLMTIFPSIKWLQNEWFPTIELKRPCVAWVDDLPNPWFFAHKYFKTCKTRWAEWIVKFCYVSCILVIGVTKLICPSTLLLWGHASCRMTKLSFLSRYRIESISINLDYLKITSSAYRLHRYEDLALCYFWPLYSSLRIISHS